MFTCNAQFHHQVVLWLCQSSLSRWLHYGMVTRELARHGHRTRNCLSSHQRNRMWRDSFNPNQPLHNSWCNHEMFPVFSPENTTVPFLLLPHLLLTSISLHFRHILTEWVSECRWVNEMCFYFRVKFHSVSTSRKSYVTKWPTVTYCKTLLGSKRDIGNPSSQMTDRAYQIIRRTRWGPQIAPYSRLTDDTCRRRSCPSLVKMTPQQFCRIMPSIICYMYFNWIYSFSFFNGDGFSSEKFNVNPLARFFHACPRVVCIWPNVIMTWTRTTVIQW